MGKRASKKDLTWFLYPIVKPVIQHSIILSIDGTPPLAVLAGEAD